MDFSPTNEASKRRFLNNDNCNSIFKIPSHLLKSFGPVLPSKASLKVDESRNKWMVSIEKFKGHYFFTDGWKEFAEQVDLKSLDFLTFSSGSMSKQKGNNKGKTRGKCGNVNVTTRTSSVQNKNADKSSRIETTFSFSKEMKLHHRYSVDLPKDIALHMGICKGDKIELKDREGREWPVRVREKSRGTFSLKTGWGDFVIDNKVMLGSTISFAWLSGKTLQVEIVEAGTDTQPLFSAANTREKRLQDPNFMFV